MRENDTIEKRLETKELTMLLLRQCGWRLDHSRKVCVFCYEVVILHKHNVCVNNIVWIFSESSTKVWDSLMFLVNRSAKFWTNLRNSCLENLLKWRTNFVSDLSSSKSQKFCWISSAGIWITSSKHHFELNLNIRLGTHQNGLEYPCLVTNRGPSCYILKKQTTIDG